MKMQIQGSPKEIADFVIALQSQQIEERFEHFFDEKCEFISCLATRDISQAN